MSELVKVSEAAAGVAVFELNNPPANTYSYDMMRALDAAILDARMDPSVHVIVIRGVGDKFFCAGADIGMLQGADPDFKYHFCLHANETLLRLEQTPMLVIAAINGHCVGGGLEVALGCDLRVGIEGGRGKVGLPEVHLGVLPGTGGTQRLSRVVGKSAAIRLMAEYAAGFCPPGKASRAVGHIKRAVQTGWELPLEAGLALERELQQRLFTSEDAAEGIAAYNEKRPAKFTGR